MSEISELVRRVLVIRQAQEQQINQIMREVGELLDSGIRINDEIIEKLGHFAPPPAARTPSPRTGYTNEALERMKVQYPIRGN